MANALGNIGSAVLGGLKGGAEALAAHSPGYNQFKRNQAQDMAIETQKMERWIKIATNPAFSKELRATAARSMAGTKAFKTLVGSVGGDANNFLAKDYDWEGWIQERDAGTERTLRRGPSGVVTSATERTKSASELPTSEKSRFSKASNFMRAGENLLTAAWQEEDPEQQIKMRGQAREMIQQAVELMKGVQRPKEVKDFEGRVKKIQESESKKAKENSPTSAAIQDVGGIEDFSDIQQAHPADPLRNITGPPAPLSEFTPVGTPRRINTMEKPKDLKDFEERMANLPTKDARARYYRKWYKDIKDK